MVLKLAFARSQAVWQSFVLSQLVLVQILIWNIVLGHFMGVHFLRILIVSLLHTRHRTSFKNVSLFDQFIDALGIRLLSPGQPLQITRLPIGRSAFSRP